MAIKIKKLNEKQEKILAFLENYQDAFDTPPNIREIGDGTGISSTSVVNY